MIKKILFTGLFSLIISFSTSAQTTLNYIQDNLQHAQELMRENHIPASIILAIAIHESAAGTSKIARYLNNHFGVKGSNSSTKIRSAYKDYDNVEDSYNHFIEFMHSRASFNKLFDKYSEDDYIGWARGIQRGGYAHSKTWASQVIALIKKYELFQYDEIPDDET